MPPVYNSKKSDGRTTQQTKLLSQHEFNAALGSGYSAMKNQFVVKTEKFCDEIGDLRMRIRNYNLGNQDHGLDDSDIEFLEEEIDDSSDSEAEFDAIIPQPALVVIKTDSNEDEENVSTESTQTQSGPVSPDNTIENSNELEQQNDNLYGLLSCEPNDVSDLYFPDYETSIRAPIANILRAWNTSHPFSTYLYDKRFLGVLLRETFGTQFMELDENRISFVKRLFEVRVDGNVDRLNSFDAIVEEKRQRANEKKCLASSDK